MFLRNWNLAKTTVCHPRKQDHVGGISRGVASSTTASIEKQNTQVGELGWNGKRVGVKFEKKDRSKYWRNINFGYYRVQNLYEFIFNEELARENVLTEDPRASGSLGMKGHLTAVRLMFLLVGDVRCFQGKVGMAQN